MSERTSPLGRYRGPAITVGLAATLLAALALPHYMSDSRSVSSLVSLKTPVAGTVEEVEVGVGQRVAKGDLLVKLSDIELLEQIAKVQHELNVLEASSKTAVAEPILGGIGTVPRVVMVPAKEDSLPQAPIAPAKPTVDPQLEAQLATAKKQLAATAGDLAKTTAETPGLQTQLEDAKGIVGLAQEALAAAQRAQATAQKEADRMQRLLEQGAVAKRRADAAKTTVDACAAEVASQQDRVDQAQARVTDLEKRIAASKDQTADLTAKQAELNAKITELNAKVAAQQAAPAAPAPAPEPKMVKKVVMSSAPIGSTAPLSVKLVDTEDPELQKKIEDARARLEALQARLSDLEIRAPFAGRIARIEVKAGDSVSAASVVVTVEAP